MPFSEQGQATTGGGWRHRRSRRNGHLMKKLLAAATTSAVAAALTVVPAGSASAAPRAPLHNVITAKQFPGFKVVDKPAVSKESAETSNLTWGLSQ